MSKNTSLMFVAVALSISYSLIADASPIPKAIKAQYTKVIAIIQKNDMKAYDAFLPADYVSVDSRPEKSRIGKSISWGFMI